MTTLEEVFLHLGEEEEVEHEDEQEAGGCASWFRYRREAAKFTAIEPTMPKVVVASIVYYYFYYSTVSIPYLE
jgi:hypothetical protein